jgi:gliding motility-associated-like protein
MNSIKLYLFFLLFLNLNIGYSQNVTLCLGQDATVCPGQTVTINDCSNVGGGAAAGSAQYAVVNIPYAPDPFNLGTPITLSDDAISTAQNIGFSFCFFGNTYTQFYIGSNGWVGFTPNPAGQNWTAYTSASIPVVNASVPRNCILAPWQDWHPGTGTGGPYIRYQVLGTAPNRRLVVSWNNCPMFSCTSSFGTFQIVLFESTNNVETRMQNKPNCLSWGQGTAVHGLHNLAGNAAVVVPGRNSTQWTTTDNAWRFTPQVTWGNTLGQTFPYNGGSLNVNPVPPGTTGYFLKSGCSAGGSGNAISDTTWLTAANPSVTVSTQTDFCSLSQGSVTAIPGAGSTAPFTYSWTPSGATTATVNGLGAGTYTVNFVDANGCTATASGTVGDSPVTFSIASTLISCGGGNNGTATATASPTSPIVTYLWSDGQTTQTAVGLVAGTYTCTISAGAGCSDVLSVNVTEIPPLQASITNQTNVTCNSASNGTATVSASLGTAPYTFIWSGTSNTSTSVNNLPAGPNSVIVSDANGCSVTLNFNLTQPNPLSIIQHTPDTLICANSIITLRALGIGGSSAYTYTWTENGNPIGTGTSIVVTPTGTVNNYCVTLSEQCGSPTDQECFVVTNPTQIFPTVSPDKIKVCEPGVFNFTNTSNLPNEIATTNYTFSNNSSYTLSGAQSLNATFPTVGVYGVTMTVTSIYGCVYDTVIPILIEVIPIPTASFNFSKNPATWFETTVQAFDNSVGDVVNWQWLCSDALSVGANGNSASLVFAEGVAGTYPVTLIVATEEGCIDTTTINLNIIPDVIMYVPNSFTPDGDEHNQTWKFYIEGIDFMNFKVEILNRWGELIWESNDARAEWDGTFNNQKVQQGSYIWKISYKEFNSDGRKQYSGYINVLK